MKRELNAFFKAFTYAFSGIIHGIKHERNVRFHLCAAVTVTMLMRFYDLDDSEKCAVFLCIGGVIAAELMNTAVENAVDISGNEPSPFAKAAKDCAAGAVLVMSACAFICGLILFWDIGIFSEIADYFACHSYAAVGAVIWAAAAFWFIFGFKAKPNN